MKTNLDSLKSEIAGYLQARGFTLFYGFSRANDEQPAVYWDTLHYPDFRPFLAAAQDLGVKLIVFHHRAFAPAAVDDAMERLEEADIAPDDRRSLERQLREMRVYEGLTCTIELSFEYQGRLYLYDLHTDWYVEFLKTLDEIDSYIPEEDEEEDEGSLGGYFSSN